MCPVYLISVFVILHASHVPLLETLIFNQNSLKTQNKPNFRRFYTKNSDSAKKQTQSKPILPSIALATEGKPNLKLEACPYQRGASFTWFAL